MSWPGQGHWSQSPWCLGQTPSDSGNIVTLAHSWGPGHWRPNQVNIPPEHLCDLCEVCENDPDCQVWLEDVCNAKSTKLDDLLELNLDTEYPEKQIMNITFKRNYNFTFKYDG